MSREVGTDTQVIWFWPVVHRAVMHVRRDGEVMSLCGRWRRAPGEDVVAYGQPGDSRPVCKMCLRKCRAAQRMTIIDDFKNDLTRRLMSAHGCDVYANSNPCRACTKRVQLVVQVMEIHDLLPADETESVGEVVD